MSTVNQMITVTSHRKQVVKDYEAASKLASLLYDSCDEKGISRQSWQRFLL